MTLEMPLALRPSVTLLAWFAALICAEGAAAQSGAVGTAPTPDWVVAVEPPSGAQPAALNVRRGVLAKLVDHQVRFDGEERVDYARIVQQALAPQGIEQVGNLRVEFDPEFQTLTLHQLEVRRGGVVQSRLKDARITVLRREEGLDALWFDGRLTASVVLDDIREGDTVDFAYSRRGTNPVFGGRQAGALDMGWSDPIALRSARVTWPSDRPIFWKSLGGAPLPTVEVAGAETVFQWSLSDLPPTVVEPDTPTWHDPFPWVQFSEFADWGAVARWAEPLYEPPLQPGPGVEQEIDRLRGLGRTPTERLMATLRFVQDEIRYLGFEIGANTHLPHAPEWVLAHRFGDCKDKTLLAITLLRGLGIEARAALVSTGRRHEVAQLHPSPIVFSHVLLCVILDGQTLWLDPTRTGQGGSGPESWVQADFGRALVVAAETNGLVEMAGPAARTRVLRVQADLDLRAGRDEAAPLTITTKAVGVAAETLRADLVSLGKAELHRRYEQFYATRFPGLVSVDELSVSDDRAANEATVIERYRIPVVWRPTHEVDRFEANIAVPDLDEQTQRLAAGPRHMPLAVGEPVDLQLTTIVHLAPDWHITPEELQVIGDAFQWQRSVSFEANILTLHDLFRRSAEELPPDGAARHADLLEDVREQSGYALYEGGAHEDEEVPTLSPRRRQAVKDASFIPLARGSESDPHWLPAVLATLALVAMAHAAGRLWRWVPPPGKWETAGLPRARMGRTVGLHLVLLGSVVLLSVNLAGTADHFGRNQWVSLVVKERIGSHPAGWSTYVLIELVLRLFALGGIVLSSLLLLAQRPSALRVLVTTLLVAIGVVVARQVVATVIFGDHNPLVFADSVDPLPAAVVHLLLLWQLQRYKTTGSPS